MSERYENILILEKKIEYLNKLLKTSENTINFYNSLLTNLEYDSKEKKKYISTIDEENKRYYSYIEQMKKTINEYEKLLGIEI